MNKLYKPLPSNAQAAFAGLDVAARQATLERSVADAPGGFAKKSVAGRLYWYYRLKNADGNLVQVYIGPDDQATRQLMAAHKDPQLGQNRAALVRMARAALEYGCTAIPEPHQKVIDRLAAHGFFSAGGILVGTHAFLAFQNQLGVRWLQGDATLDLDFAHAGRNVSLALPASLSMDTRSAIESLQMGFAPIHSQTTYKKADEPDFDLDFLTSMGRNGDQPVEIKQLNVVLQPLRFMELSLEDPMRATLVARAGPVVVNVPQAQRFALHKLIVHGERVQSQRVKANKDLAQAAAVLDYLLDEDADELAALWQETIRRGPGWKSRLDEGWRAVNLRFPDQLFAERLARALSTGTEVRQIL